MAIDEKIKKNVTDQLYWDHRVDASDVQIEVDDGVVTLSGNVPSFTAKDVAYDDAWFVGGVRLVINNLDVEYVTVDNGVVTLNGTVPSRRVITAAHDAALYTYGVIDIVDELAVQM